LRREGLLRQAEDVSGMGVGDNIVCQSAATPFHQDRLRKLLDALGDGAAVERRALHASGGNEAGDGVDDMVGEGSHIEVAARRGTGEIVMADRLGDMLHHDQCLFGTGEFAHGFS
jgi:hypothetical protein